MWSSGDSSDAGQEVLDDTWFLFSVAKRNPWQVSSELLEQLRTGDVLVHCKGGRVVRCHQAILAAASPVLRGLLTVATAGGQGCSPTQPAVLLARDVAAEHWLYMLMHLYPLTPPPAASPNPRNAAALAILGHMYEMPKVLTLWTGFADRCRGRPWIRAVDWLALCTAVGVVAWYWPREERRRGATLWLH